MADSTEPVAETAVCPRCGKPLPLCVCDSIVPVENRIEVLILQHPQEQDRLLGTARLTATQLTNASLKIGLSWPSLAKILGRDVDHARWAVIYLGSSKVANLDTDRDVVVIDRNGEMKQRQDEILKGIEGVILLDGTWSQAKALWWRNAWMLKCQRIILGPSQVSRYGKLRREPRRDGLSTIEAAAMVLGRLEREPQIETALITTFERMLGRYRNMQASMPELLPAPRPKTDWRKKCGPQRRRSRKTGAKA